MEEKTTYCPECGGLMPLIENQSSWPMLPAYTAHCKRCKKNWRLESFPVANPVAKPPVTIGFHNISRCQGCGHTSHSDNGCPLCDCKN